MRLFKDTIPLEIEYIPSKIRFREGEVQRIRSLIELHRSGVRANLLVQGPIGCGKSLVAKYLLREHRDLMIYVSCREYDTFKSVLREILAQTGVTARKKASASELIDILVRERSLDGKILVLDEVDQNIHYRRLVGLSRLPESSNVRFSLFCITNRLDFEMMLTPREWSAYTPHKLLFRRYTPDEIAEILLQRIELAKHPNVVLHDIADIGAIRLIAHYCYARKESDVRFALLVLKTAIRMADHRVTPEVAEAAIDEIEINPIREFIQRESTTTKMILRELLKGEREAAQLYEAISPPESYRNFIRRLHELSVYGLIKVRKLRRKGAPITVELTKVGREAIKSIQDDM